MKHNVFSKTVLTAAVLVAAGTASAALSPAASFTGNVGMSVDGIGFGGLSGSVQAKIPVGSTILQAFLYSATYADSSTATLAQFNSAGISLGGSVVSNFSKIVGIDGFSTGRADVTSLVKSLTLGAATSDFSFIVGEGSQNSFIDGEVLAIAYSNPLLPQGSVAFLDGGQSQTGETTTVTFAGAISDPSAAGFAAELGLGISFSCGCGASEQKSNVKINGKYLTSFAGDNNDGLLDTNGSLITVGGLGDTPSYNETSYASDDELYDLRPFLTTGDTAFTIFTDNPSFDDNIFFASLYVTAKLGDVNGEPPVDLPTDPTSPIPEPETYALMLMGLGVVGAMARRRRVKN